MTLVTDEMVNRYLTWPLPDSVCADLCATRQGDTHRTGTNLLSATEARQMLEHVLATSGPSHAYAELSLMQQDNDDLRDALDGLMWRFADYDSDPHSPEEKAPDVLTARAVLARNNRFAK